MGAVIRGSWNTEKIREWNSKHPFTFANSEAVVNFKIFTGRIAI
jgi:hypothetical protein